jgi:acetyl-CoA synthetase/acetyltransferase
MVGLSNLACDLGDLIAEMDVNPLLAGPDGAIAVDALVIPTGWPRSP